MKHIKTAPQRQCITLVLYEAVKVIPTLKIDPYTNNHYRKLRKGYKEIARESFNTPEDVANFLKGYSYAEPYRHYSKGEWYWTLPKHPKGDETRVLCITNYDQPIYAPKSKPCTLQRYHPGSKRPAGRRYYCSCWYCLDLKVKQDLSPKKAKKAWQQQELLGDYASQVKI